MAKPIDTSVISTNDSSHGGAYRYSHDAVREALGRGELGWPSAVAMSEVHRLLAARGQNTVADLVRKTQELALNAQRSAAPEAPLPITQQELGELAGFMKERGVTSKDLRAAVSVLEREEGTPEERRAYADGSAVLRMFLSLRAEMHRFQRNVTPQGAPRAYDWSCAVAEPRQSDEVFSPDSPLRDPATLAARLGDQFSAAQAGAVAAPGNRAVTATCRTSLPPAMSWDKYAQSEHPGLEIAAPKVQRAGSTRPQVPLAPRRADDSLDEADERSIAKAFVAAIGRVGLLDDVSDLGHEYELQEQSAAVETFDRVMHGATLRFDAANSSRKEPFLAVVKRLYDVHRGEALLADPVYGTYDAIWDARAKAAFRDGIDRATLAALALDPPVPDVSNK